VLHINLQPVVGQQYQQDGGEKGLRVQPYLCTVMVLDANKSLHHSYSQHGRRTSPAVYGAKRANLLIKVIKVIGCQKYQYRKTCLLWKDVSYIRAAPCFTLPFVVQAVPSE